MEERHGGWRTEPEATPASGGHMPPDMQSPGAFFDHLLEPSESETEPSRPERTDVVPRGSTGTFTRVDRPRASRREAARARRSRVSARRVKRTLTHIHPISVLKISLFMYMCFLVLWLVFVGIVYSILRSAGLFETLESVGEGFALGWEVVEIGLWTVERWAFLIGLGFVLLGSLVNVFLSFLFNVGADLVGGVETTVVERDGDS